MGCASSTPMVATAGSEMLKAATHVASDAAKGAENAVGEVTETVGKTLESTKETVGTAVTGIAHDLSNAFTEKANELDTAKNELLERLHLGDDKTVEQANETSTNHLDTKALEAAARLPTPPPDFNGKISTNETETNEHGKANSAEQTTSTGPPATIAELEQLTKDVKQTAQSNADGLQAMAGESSATAVTEGIVGAKEALTEATIGTTTATEPAVELNALLAMEKRPGTTDWEKHADHLSKTRKRNAFKGGGKFRRFGPAAPQIQSIHPANYILPIEPNEGTERVETRMKTTMKNSLLEDDSCYSDVYYNSRSSSPYSTSSNSPLLRRRRPRLPTNSVLAMNAKHMQRELAALLSDRRSAVRSLHVSPIAPRRHFDYNPQRVRYASPTPSMIGRNTPPIVIQPELPPLARITNWKRNKDNTTLAAIPAHVAGALQPTTHLNSPPLSNVITQPKIKPTKAFAPLRGPTKNTRTQIFGQTRTGSPVNRRVFATRRSDVTQANKTRFVPRQTSSPLRTRALIQERIEAAQKVERQMAQPPTIIKLERDASKREDEAHSIAELRANGFSLSQALSPIKMAAESRSLRHLNRGERKVKTSTPHTLLEVVEQAVERTKSGERTARVDVRSGEVGGMSREIAKEKEVGNKSQKEEKVSVENKRTGNKPEAKLASSPNSRNTKGKSGATGMAEGPMKNDTPARENHTANSNTSSGRSRKVVMRDSSENQGSSSVRRDMMEDRNEERFSASSNKKEENVSSKTKGKITSSGSVNEYKKELRSSAKRTQTNSNNREYCNKENGGVKYTNISNRFEPLAKTNIMLKGRRTQDEEDDRTTTTSDSIDSDFSQSSRHGTRTSHKVIYSTETTEEYENTSPTRTNETNGVSWNNEKHNKLAEPNNNKHRPKSSKDPVHTHPESIHAKDNLSKNLKINGQQSPQPHTTNPKNTATKTEPPTHINPPVPNSLNSSPSRSSKSSTSIVIRTILSTPETEVSNEVSIPKRFYEEFGHHRETIEEVKDRETLNHFQEEFEQQHKTLVRTIRSATETDEINEMRFLEHEDIATRDEAIEAAILSTTETEESSERESPKRLHEQHATTEAMHFSETSLEENTSAEMEHNSTDLHVSNSSTDFEASINSKMKLHSPEADENTVIYAASSLEDLLKLLPPQTTYLKLGRSATTLALRSTTPILDAQSLSYRSTPQRRYKRHSTCDGYHDDRVPFVSDLSSAARSRSPLVPLSPYTIRACCAVCYNKYVIK